MKIVLPLFKNFVDHEVPYINNALQREIAVLHPAVRPVAEHVLSAGGKRLRPLLTLLFARLAGSSDDMYALSCSLELVHSATLMHDDIVDKAELRRGRAAAHVLFGQTRAILAGDALLALSCAIVARFEKTEMTTCLADATMQTAAGEILEIAALRNPVLTRDEYLEIITGKTAYLIQCACELGVLAAGADADIRANSREFGLNLGIAFQLVDDALDYTSAPETSGKPLGGDLREGKVTLPLLTYMETLSAADRQGLSDLLASKNPDAADQEKVITEVIKQGCAEETRALARTYLEKAKNALGALPRAHERNLLQAMLDFVLSRKY